MESESKNEMELKCVKNDESFDAFDELHSFDGIEKDIQKSLSPKQFESIEYVQMDDNGVIKVNGSTVKLKIIGIDQANKPNNNIINDSDENDMKAMGMRAWKRSIETILFCYKCGILRSSIILFFTLWMLILDFA